MDGEPVIPAPLPDDDDDVAWALQTAQVQWQRGAHGDAVVWIRRAVDAAIISGNAQRTQELSELAAAVADQLVARASQAPDSPSPSSRPASDSAGDVDSLLTRGSEAPPARGPRRSASSLTSEIPIDVDGDFVDEDVEDDDAQTLPPPPRAREDEHSVADFELFGDREAAPSTEEVLSVHPGELFSSAPPASEAVESVSAAELFSGYPSGAIEESPFEGLGGPVGVEVDDAREPPAPATAESPFDEPPTPAVVEPAPVFAEPAPEPEERLPAVLGRLPEPPKPAKVEPPRRVPAAPRPVPSRAAPPRADAEAKAPLASPKPAAVAPKAPLASPKPAAVAPKPVAAAPKPVAAAPKVEPVPLAKAEKPEPPRAAPRPSKAEPSPEPARVEPPPAPPAAATVVDGVALETVRGFEDLPEETQLELARAATLTTLASNDEVGFFGAALVTQGRVGLMASIADVAASVASRGEVVFTRGSLDEGISLRVVALDDDTVVATWSPADLERALAECPWVADELRLVADRFQALAGATLGSLGDALDDNLRGLVLSRLDVKAYAAGEAIVEAGKPVPGLHVVGAGHVELLRDGKIEEEAGPGDILFAAEVLGAGKAGSTARAGKGGAVILAAPRAVAHELLLSVPPLIEILAG